MINNRVNKKDERRGTNMKNVEAESLGTVHTHTHTHTQYTQKIKKQVAKKLIKVKLIKPQ